MIVLYFTSNIHLYVSTHHVYLSGSGLINSGEFLDTQFELAIFCDQISIAPNVITEHSSSNQWKQKQRLIAKH